MILGPDGSKMSKSAGNVVNPDELVEEYGADVVRLNLCFMGPVEANKPWSGNGLDAMRKFLRRLTKVVSEKDSWVEGDGDGKSLKALHRTIHAVGQDMERYRFNTAIARMMEFLNVLQRTDSRGKGALGKFMIMLSPLAPHYAEEMWSFLGNDGSILTEPYPEYSEEHLQEDEVEIAIQILGKVKARVNVAAGLDANAQGEAVHGMSEVQELLKGVEVVKTISVPGRLVNFVVKK